MFKSEPIKETSLFNHPKLHQARAINKLSEALGDLKRFFAYGSLQGRVLFLYFSHPIGVSEFSLKKEQILERMREIYKQNELKKVIIFTDVKAKVVPVVVEKQKKENNSYNEIAKGDFDISHIKNKEIKRVFERIKANIKANKEAQND